MLRRILTLLSLVKVHLVYLWIQQINAMLHRCRTEVSGPMHSRLKERMGSLYQLGQDCLFFDVTR
jgi:hypothetical protein